MPASFRPIASRLFLRQAFALLMVGLLLIGVGLHPPVAEAKKKKAGLNEKQLEEGLTPLNTTLNTLLVKVQSRYLFSPGDAGKLADLKFKMLDFMQQLPSSPLLLRPVYQTAVLFSKRDMPEDAYEFYSFLVVNFPSDPYALRASRELDQLRKKYGENTFPAIASAVTSTAPASAAGVAGAADKKKS